MSVVLALEAEDGSIPDVALPLRYSLEAGVVRLPCHSIEHYYSSAAYSTLSNRWNTSGRRQPIPFAAGDLYLIANNRLLLGPCLSGKSM